jgi:chemotaxis protein MotA
MDIATILGLVACAALIVGSVVLGGSPQMFLNLPSVLVVIGGTIGATLVKNPLQTVLRTFSVIGNAFFARLPSPSALNERIIELAKEARKNGVLALENVDVEYEFLAKGVTMAVDGIDLENIRAVMESDVRSTISRHRNGRSILEGMGAAAPAFGMIGTLIGLVQMLAKLDDPSSIGPSMAVALLTTLYGAVLANVVFLPLAGKLKGRSEEELQVMLMCIEGVAGIVDADNPNAIDQRLKAFIAPHLREAKEAA